MAQSEPNGTAPQREETVEELNAALRKMMPLEEDDPRRVREKGLLIFDGSSNQKLPILMWMGDRVLRSIREERAKTNNDTKKNQFNHVESSFRSVFERIRTMAFDITESISPYSEQFRKDAIERFARVINCFDKQVEELVDKPPPKPVTVIPTHDNDVARYISWKVAHDQAEQAAEAITPPHQDFFEIPRAAVPMTRISGVPNSRYVSPKPKGITIHELAYADQDRQVGRIPYNIDLNDTYEEVLQGIPKNLTYVGAVYPDGSSLSYLPIKGITLLRLQSDAKFPTQDEGGVVELLLPRMIYDRIKQICALSYRERYPDHTFRFPFEQVIDRRNIKVQALARGYRRMRIINGKRIFHVSLLEALTECSHDMTGDALLHLRFDRSSREDKRATMKLIFFGLQMVRDPSNHFQKIFRL